MEPQVNQNYLNSNAVDANPSNYSDSTVSPKLGVTYQMDDQHSVYGQYAAGYAHLSSRDFLVSLKTPHVPNPVQHQPKKPKPVTAMN